MGRICYTFSLMNFLFSFLDTGLSGSNLVQMVRKATLTETEIATLIEVISHKQGGGQAEWTKVRLIDSSLPGSPRNKYLPFIFKFFLTPREDPGLNSLAPHLQEFRGD